MWEAMSEDNLKDSGRAFRSRLREEGGMDMRVLVKQFEEEDSLSRLPPSPWWRAESTQLLEI